LNPTAALQSPIFRGYALAILGILVFAGLAIAAIQAITKKELKSVWVTWRGWVVMVPLMLGAMWAGRIPMVLLLAVLATAGFKEFARATGIYRDWTLCGTVYLLIVAGTVVTLVRNPNHGGDGWYGMFMTLPVFGIALLLTLPILRNQPAGQIQAVSLAIVGFVYIGWMFGHLAFLANCEHAYGYLLYLLFAVAVGDVSAFTFGRLFGKRKLCSRISPNKTWAGSFGGLGVSMVAPWLLRFSFPHFTALDLVLTGLIVGIGGQLGDLVLSFIKRDIGIKDMGALIPGHGGVLDRINSTIYVAPLFLHLVDYRFKHWW
jgi:phosphatidate cytidylyltransferase